MSSDRHKSVLLNESIGYLNITPGKGVWVDATLGLGGHSEAILKALGNEGRVLGLDVDNRNLASASERLKEYKNFKAIKSNFSDLDVVLRNEGIEGIDGILFDLGVSSAHLDEAERGFSFMKEAPLDMRLNPEARLTAADVVNKYKQADLERIIREYGEEHQAGKLAAFIVKNRPIETTVRLSEIIQSAKRGKREKIHPATLVFQAIRIEVNDELNALKQALEKSLAALKSRGRIAVISFHSLEDRIVKQYFQREAVDCVCENKKMPCMCNHKRSLNILTKKVVTPSAEEVAGNPRARSAKLRAAEKI